MKESLVEKMSVEKERFSSFLKVVRELIHEGNSRRLLVKNSQKATLIDVPLTVGVIGAVLLPVWAVIAAMAAIAMNSSVTVEHRVR